MGWLAFCVPVFEQGDLSLNKTYQLAKLARVYGFSLFQAWERRKKTREERRGKKKRGGWGEGIFSRRSSTIRTPGTG